MKKINKIIIRRILNSTGGDAYEAEVCLEGGGKGVASAPVAIEPGKREKQTTGSKISYFLIIQITALLCIAIFSRFLF